MNLTALIWTFILGIFIVIGSFIVFFVKNNDKFIAYSIGMAFSVMMLLGILDLLPEIWELLNGLFSLPLAIILILAFVGIGIFLLKMLDLFIPDHDCDHEHPATDKNLYHIGLISAIALILHNIIEGMAVFGMMTNSFRLGFMVCIGIGLHNVPLGMVITSTVYKSTDHKKKTILFMIPIVLSTGIGGTIMYLFGTLKEEILVFLMCLTLGMIFYIVFFELLPQLKESQEKKATLLGGLTGAILLLISFFL